MPTYSQPSTVPGYGVEFLGDPCASVHLNPVSTNVSGASEVAANTTSDTPTPGVASNAASVSGSGSSLPASSAIPWWNPTRLPTSARTAT
jgi:hypothetical protein